MPAAPLTIVSLELGGSGGGQVRIRFSDGSTLDCPVEVVARAAIVTGSTIDPVRYSSLRREGAIVSARERALALLGRSAHTRRGLARKLLARGFEAEAVRAAVARMVELGYIDDRAFARDWVRVRLAGHAEGWKALYRGLTRRGVPRRIAEEAASELCPEEVELEQARRVASRFAPRAAAARLTSRGFRARTIARVIRELRDRQAGGA